MAARIITISPSNPICANRALNSSDSKDNLRNTSKYNSYNVLTPHFILFSYFLYNNNKHTNCQKIYNPQLTLLIFFQTKRCYCGFLAGIFVI